MIIVLDTNIIVSAAMVRGNNIDKAYNLAFKKGTVLFSKATLNEAINSLNKPKIQKYIRALDKAKFLEQLINRAVLVDVLEKIEICRDPKDNKFLERAVSGNADVIVTGDADLLVLNPFRGISIVGPKAFLDL